MLKLNNLFYVALIFTAFLFLMNLTLSEPPVVKPATVASNEFSGERAFKILSNLLRENEPHPVGSTLNKVVKERIIDELNKYNIETSVQQTWACSNNVYNCAFVENIIAIIPGKTDSDYVALMSHYDSVPTSAGAGDDGAAVASMLETARILKSEAPFNKPIMLLFTDAEENGLIGAEAFFKQHRLAKDISVVLNFEGSGTKGVSQVLRTSGANKLLIDAYASESSHPRGASLINEVFKRMPNDTDFSVVRRANIPGIDLSFAEERNHYHTPNDNLDNLDPRTIQHHGENMLPTTQWLANNDFASDENLVYSHVYNGWTQWPATYTPILIAVCFILLVITCMRTDATIGGVAHGTGISLLVFVASGLVSYAVFELIAVLQGTTVSWPAHDLPYRIALFSSGLLGGLLAALLSNKYLSFHNAMSGAWFVWLLLSIVLYIYTPDAANLLVLPLLVATLIYLVASFLHEHLSRYFLLLSLILVVPSTLGLVLPLETTQGYRLIFVTMPFIALFMTVFVPLTHGAKLKLPLSITTVTLALAIIIALNSPLYSEHRPQHVNIIYFENLDEDQGYYWLQHQNPLPENLKAAMDWSSEKKLLLPYSTYEHSNWARVAPSDLSYAEYRVISDEVRDDGRTLQLVLTSARNARTLQFVIPGTAKLKSFKLGNNEFEPQPIVGDRNDRYHFLRLDGIYAREVSMTLELESTESFQAFLIDRSTVLPESAKPLLEVRSGLSSPQHTGDRAILIQTITL